MSYSTLPIKENDPTPLDLLFLFLSGRHWVHDIKQFSTFVP